MKPYFKSSRYQKNGSPDVRMTKKILDYINITFIEPANAYLAKTGNKIEIFLLLLKYFGILISDAFLELIIKKLEIIEKVEEIESVINISNTDEPKKRCMDNTLSIKDSGYISDRLYSKIRSTLELKTELPTLFSIRKHAKELNQLQIYSNSKGVFVSILEKLKNHVTLLLIKNKIKITEDKPLTIKFCGDGTNISKKAIKVRRLII